MVNSDRNLFFSFYSGKHYQSEQPNWTLHETAAQMLWFKLMEAIKFHLEQNVSFFKGILIRTGI